MRHADPTEADAAAIVEAALAVRATDVRRFPTGLANHVYEVESDAGTVVARLAHDDARIEDAVRWHRLLAPLGVPLAALLGHGTHPFPFMLLDRLPGTDLGRVYGTLDVDDKAAIAGAVADAQRRVASLGPLGGYGYARRPGDPALFGCWSDVVRASVGRSRGRIEGTGVLSAGPVRATSEAIERLAGRLDAAPPTPFLDDATTKNVLVHRGRLTGIVDVDWLCAGDRRFVAALTRVSLVAAGHDTVYADLLLEAMDGDADEALWLYEAVFCLDLLGEMGQVFNRAEAAPRDDAVVARLTVLLQDRLDALAR